MEFSSAQHLPSLQALRSLDDRLLGNELRLVATMQQLAIAAATPEHVDVTQTMATPIV